MTYRINTCAVLIRLAVVLALVLVPVGIAVEHGAGAAFSMVAAEDGDADNHVWEDAEEGQHDATDHEHQTTALLPGAGGNWVEASAILLLVGGRVPVGRSRDGPRRPPCSGVI
ncbi:MAG: hypothetical protein ACT4OK_02170 [Gemmobacter sp.]